MLLPYADKVNTFFWKIFYIKTNGAKMRIRGKNRKAHVTANSSKVIILSCNSVKASWEELGNASGIECMLQWTYGYSSLTFEVFSFRKIHHQWQVMAAKNTSRTYNILFSKPSKYILIAPIL